MPIQVKVLNAILSRNTQTISNMDPYCLINVGQQYRRTTTKDEAGLNPVWNEILFFLNYHTQMRLQVFDADLITDDLIGSSMLNITQIFTKPNTPFKFTLDLIYKKEKAGVLNVEIIYLGGSVQPVPQIGLIGVGVPVPVHNNRFPLRKPQPKL